MIEILHYPTLSELTESIEMVGCGVISAEWIESAHKAIYSWIGGRIYSSPYGNLNSPLSVEWQWDDGELTVTITHAN